MKFDRVLAEVYKSTILNEKKDDDSMSIKLKDFPDTGELINFLFLLGDQAKKIGKKDLANDLYDAIENYNVDKYGKEIPPYYKKLEKTGKDPEVGSKLTSIIKSANSRKKILDIMEDIIYLFNDKGKYSDLLSNLGDSISNSRKSPYDPQ